MAGWSEINSDPVVYQNYFLAISNTGCGSTTVLNSYMSSKGIGLDKLFKSGVFLGYSTDSTLESIIGPDGTNFMNLPGLKSVERGKLAAQSLTDCLQNDGEFKIIFVIILAAGKVKYSDIDNFKMVLYSLKDLTHYGIVINQASKRILRNQVEFETRISGQIKTEIDSNATPHIFFLPRYEEIEDTDNAIIDNPGLIQFIDSIPTNELLGQHVDPLPINFADEEHINFLRNKLRETEDVIKKLEEDKELINTFTLNKNYYQ